MQADAATAVVVRRATRADVDAICVGNRAMAAETEGVELDAATLARGVAAVFDDPGHGFYLVATEGDGGPVIGQLMVTFEWSDWRDGRQWWIQSVWVAPRARRRGVYRALHEQVVREARADGAAGVRLYVERENTRAQATYRAMGMHEAPYLMFEVDFVLRKTTDG
jgi:ribosomal protein S18 acetylase RimI-like enzyme